jgi:hypothetical protein
MRDSLFWEMIMPDERLGLQVYVYLTAHGKSGFNVCVWGPGRNRRPWTSAAVPCPTTWTSTTSGSGA